MSALVALTSCGGGKSNETEETVQEDEIVLPEDVTVPVEDSVGDTYFTGLDLSEVIELVPGDYKLTAENDWNLSARATVKVKVIGTTDKDVSAGDTYIRVYDDDVNELAEMHMYDGFSALNNALAAGETDGVFDITFICYPDSEEELATLFSKAKKIEAGPVKGKERKDGSSSSSSNSSSGDLPMTLSEYGVTYQCVHNPADNDTYLKNYKVSDAMSSKDKIIEAWEIMEEELLRYQFAPGENGMDNPEAFNRYNKFEEKLRGGYSDDNPVGYMQNREYTFKTCGDFTPAQQQRIEKFRNNRDKAFDAWRAAGGE